MASGTRRSSRIQNSDLEFVYGEHVWIPATFFDDPEDLPEERYSANRQSSMVKGIIIGVSTKSCRIRFRDDAISMVPKDQIHHTSEAQRELRVTESGEHVTESDDEEDNDAGEHDWNPDQESKDDSGEDGSGEEESSTSEEVCSH